MRRVQNTNIMAFPLPEKLVQLTAEEYARHLEKHKIRPPTGFPEDVWTLTLGYLVENTLDGLLVNELKHGRHHTAHTHSYAWHFGEYLGVVVCYRGDGSIAIGYRAGYITCEACSSDTVAVGYHAGGTCDDGNAVAIGYHAGGTCDDGNAVAIGYLASSTH